MLPAPWGSDPGAVGIRSRCLGGRPGVGGWFPALSVGSIPAARQTDSRCVWPSRSCTRRCSAWSRRGDRGTRRTRRTASCRRRTWPAGMCPVCAPTMSRTRPAKATRARGGITSSSGGSGRAAQPVTRAARFGHEGRT
eukprot:6885680-Prymnesium_polylepis.1